MHSETITKLRTLTDDFYTKVSSSFSQTRQAPWPGWKEFAQRYAAELTKIKDLTVLDVGCGNGRFCTFIYESITQNFAYFGIDSNDALLQQTKVVLQEKNVSGEVVAVNLITELLADTFAQKLNQRNYTLLSCFGVFHHIPTQELRIRLLQSLTTLLSQEGCLIISLWRFAEFERYAQKTVDPARFGIEAAELEPGDYLLGWDTEPVARYCHSFSTTDIKELIDAVPELKLVAQYTADGKEGSANTYLVFQKN